MSSVLNSNFPFYMVYNDKAYGLTLDLLSCPYVYENNS